jgi:spore coat protein A, manganese oxidase
MVNRRHVLKAGTVTGAALLVPAALVVRRRAAVADPVPGGTLDPNTLPKYVAPLYIPPAMPRSGTAGGVDVYSVGVRQFTQQMLPPGWPATAVFGFGSTTDSSTFHTPAATIEARAGTPVRVTWSNQLVTPTGRYRPHLLPIDQTLHWANPPGGVSGRDSRPTFTSTPGPYRGPVPIVVHLHGAHVFEESDGYPEAWYLPPANNIPAGYATVGSYYNKYKAQAFSRNGTVWSTGNAVYQYPNDQRATALWYHTHDLGMTRVNIYAGLTGFYLLRGGAADLPPGVLPGPAPQRGDSPGVVYHEIPMVIQDRSFNADGSLFFPASRGFFGDTPPDGPWAPTTDVPPIWNPEFFGNTMVVNGRTWPSLNVEPRRYRFRLLNACNARTLLLRVASNPAAPRPAATALPFSVIGTDGGFIPAPVTVQLLRIAPSERMDVIVDFTRVPVGTSLYLINEGPDSPYGGGVEGTDFDPADPGTTGQVMRFTVCPSTSGPDTSVPPSQLRLPSITPVGAASKTRRLSLNELDSAFFPDAPTVGLLGTLNADGSPNPLEWMDPVTENPAVGSTEVWELYNFTADGHPIHVHLVQFQVVSRQPFDTATGALTGPARGPESWENGFKDTLVALPSEVTRLRAKFDLAGRYVWHCHIIDHEDNDMMRAYQIS